MIEVMFEVMRYFGLTHRPSSATVYPEVRNYLRARKGYNCVHH